MIAAPRKFALVALFALALAAGCGSNNKGKIEGKWKIVSLPEKVQNGKNEMAEMAKMGVYVYMEFRADGTMAFGVGADKQEMLDMVKMAAPNQKITWDGKYKLLSGDSVELYDLPKDFQGGGGLFGKDDRARVKVLIKGDEMRMTDKDGTATLTKVS
jgi:hypothetical protein